MANQKITDYAAITGANVDSSADLLEIVDFSALTNKKITRANLFDISDANGGQIVFPSTQNASSNANTLDDYEEGTWTPNLVGSGGGPLLYNYQVGTYVKIGKLVHISASISISGGSVITGNALIQTLPFTPQTLTNYSSSLSVAAWTLTLDSGYTQVTAHITSNSTDIVIYEVGSAKSPATPPAGSFVTGALIIVSGSYIAAS